MNTEQKAREWLAGYGDATLSGNKSAHEIITALLAEREALRLSMVAITQMSTIDNAYKIAMEAIAMCEEQNNE